MTSQNPRYQIDDDIKSPYPPHVQLWRAVCRVAWSDYLGLERCAYEESEQKLKREAGRFLRSSEYAELATIIEYPQFDEERFG